MSLRARPPVKPAKIVVQLGERWIDKDAKRPAVVVMLGAGTVSYRYIQGVNGSGLWRRGITPAQTITYEDWLRRFTKEKR